MTMPKDPSAEKAHKRIVLAGKAIRFIQMHLSSFPGDSYDAGALRKSGLISDQDICLPTEVFSQLEEEKDDKTNEPIVDKWGFPRWRYVGALTMKEFCALCARLPVWWPECALEKGTVWRIVTAGEWEDTIWMLPHEQARHAQALSKRASELDRTAQRHFRTAEAREQLRRTQ